VSPYIEAGYSVVLTTIAVYAATLLRREQLARRRLRRPSDRRALGAPATVPVATRRARRQGD
jgi:hypothetical protein